MSDRGRGGLRVSGASTGRFVVCEEPGTPAASREPKARESVPPSGRAAQGWTAEHREQEPPAKRGPPAAARPGTGTVVGVRGHGRRPRGTKRRKTLRAPPLGKKKGNQPPRLVAVQKADGDQAGERGRRAQTTRTGRIAFTASRPGNTRISLSTVVPACSFSCKEYRRCVKCATPLSWRRKKL